MDQVTIYLSRFNNDEAGNGGDRRAHQIYTLYKPDCFINFSAQRVSPVSSSHAVKSLLGFDLQAVEEYVKIKKFQFSREYRKWPAFFREIILTYRRQALLAYIEVLAKYKDRKLCVIIDDPLYTLPVISDVKKKGINCIAIIHNIESLAEGGDNYLEKLSLFESEINALSLPDELITISAEEYLLLTNFGFSARYLPYKPSEKIVSEMSIVRERRLRNEKKGLLMIGTVKNTPTRDGMLKFLYLFRKDSRFKKFDYLTVAGFGMEKYASLFEGERTHVITELSEEAYYKLLAETEGFVVYQEKGAGALTKVAELLEADIPVYANRVAGRSYSSPLITLID